VFTLESGRTFDKLADDLSNGHILPGAYFFDRRSRSFRRALEHHPFPLCDEGLFFAFSEPAAGRTMRINSVEFAF
jgi:hypothetical protein